MMESTAQYWRSVWMELAPPMHWATTLIVSLGIIAQPKDLVIIEVAVVLLTAQSLLINRLAGLPYPLWRSQKSETTVSQSKG